MDDIEEKYPRRSFGFVKNRLKALGSTNMKAQKTIMLVLVVFIIILLAIQQRRYHKLF